jgi:hypothetical protein
MVPTIIDIEASAFGAGSYPIEVGIALPDGATRCFLIRPEPEWTRWDPASEAAHGICRELLEQRGLPVTAIAGSLNHILGRDTVYSDAWGFDSSWLGLLFHHADIMPSFRIEALPALLSEEQTRIWHPVKQEVLEEMALERHRASSDALIIQKTYLRTLERLRPPRSRAGRPNH